MKSLIFILLSLYLQAYSQESCSEILTNRSTTRPKVTPAYRIYLADVGSREKTFMVEIHYATNPRGHRMLENYIKHGIKLDPQGNPRVGVVIGNIKRALPSSRHQFHFEFDPKSVRWNDFATEACDGRLNDVEENLEAWLQKKRFCPWTTPTLVTKIVKNNIIIWKRTQPDPPDDVEH